MLRQDIAHFAADVSLTSEGKAPTHMQLLPPGVPLEAGFSRVDAVDGRSLLIPPHEQLVAAFARKLPIDVGHATEWSSGRDSAAVGWITGLEARDTGLWAAVDWLQEGRELVESRKFTGQSPTLRIDGETGFVSMVKSAALTNDPALSLVELAAAQGTPPMPTMTNPLLVSLCSELRISAEHASVADVLAAARDGYVPKTELLSESARADKAEATLVRQDEVAFTAKATAQIGAAVKDGRIKPAEAPYYSGRCTDEKSLTETVAHIATFEKRKLDQSAAPNGPAPDGSSEPDAETLKMCRALKFTPEQITAHWTRVQAKGAA